MLPEPDQQYGGSTHQHADDGESADRLVEQQEREHHRGRRHQVQQRTDTRCARQLEVDQVQTPTATSCQQHQPEHRTVEPRLRWDRQLTGPGRDRQEEHAGDQALQAQRIQEFGGRLAMTLQASACHQPQKATAMNNSCKDASPYSRASQNTRP